MLTVASVGYAAAGVGGALLGAAVAFAPSFAFILGGAGRFSAVRSSQRVGGFLTGAGPCALGAIAGSAVPLGLALTHPWQVAVLAGALVWLLVARRGVVSALLLAALAGALVVGPGGLTSPGGTWSGTARRRPAGRARGAGSGRPGTG